MTKIKHRLLLTQTDHRLACLAQAGHEPAFEALVHRYRQPLLRYCRRLCLSDARAEEAVQQALLNAWVALKGDSEVRDVRAWLYRVAHNAALNAMRGEHSTSCSEEPLGECMRVGGATPASGTAGIEEMLALRAALAGIAALPQMQREVMVRTAVAGHSHEEVASALGISDDAVRGLLYRARSTLRAGFTAITPAWLPVWAARSAEGGAERSADVAAQRVAELAAGGGSAGLAGIAAKGGAVAITAGLAIGGVVIGHSRHHAPSHRSDHVVSSHVAAQADAASLTALDGLQAGARTDAARVRPASSGAKARHRAVLRHRGSYASPPGGTPTRPTAQAVGHLDVPAAGDGAPGDRHRSPAETPGGGSQRDRSQPEQPGDARTRTERQEESEGGSDRPGQTSQASTGEDREQTGWSSDQAVPQQTSDSAEQPQEAAGSTEATGTQEPTGTQEAGQTGSWSPTAQTSDGQDSGGSPEGQG